MSWLVTGGAGYIGAHVVNALRAQGMPVTVVDDLSSGHRDYVPVDVPFLEADINDIQALREWMRTHAVVGVIHIAGFKYAGVSVKEPLRTYRTNVEGTAHLLQAMQEADVERIVFSSSAATYGTPSEEVVTEQTRTSPESPYGESKLIGEWLLAAQGRATGLVHTSLRYFNVVGSGEALLADTSPHNLFPLVFRALEEGRAPVIFGDDYPTPDGTCVRDYIHVQDLAEAHVVAAQRLQAGDQLQPVYNLGSGDGTSVRQIMDAMRKVTGQDFEPEVRERRPGDPARIVADGSAAAADLDWRMRHSVEQMVESAWRAAKRIQA
ncbi:UDP-glucose 4-epimerase GalE [Micrococcus sp.]|uniref:UDP-glucose 4-epimerase GalE n=1 Tax=Micrococcus sp. TaxID=1271 RepID=UPI002A909AED|nr:UDP-glucose 4-epimerase GalE [Micrococcus sp.]MDY6056158.1 UDP-glucose 4-epimerase GalE [Micrococcus sp.]